MQNSVGPFHVLNLLTTCVISLTCVKGSFVVEVGWLILWEKRRVYFIWIHALHFIYCSGDISIYQLLEKDQETCVITRIHIWGWKTANFVKLSSFSFTRRAQCHGHSRIEVCGIWFVHIFFIDGQGLLLSIHLSACILEANERWHNIHDNLIDYYAFHQVSLAYEVDKLFSVLYEST